MKIGRNYINKVDEQIGKFTSQRSFDRVFDFFEESGINGVKENFERYKNGEITSLKDKLKLLENLMQINREFTVDQYLKLK